MREARSARPGLCRRLTHQRKARCRRGAPARRSEACERARIARGAKRPSEAKRSEAERLRAKRAYLIYGHYSITAPLGGYVPRRKK